jgi:DNA-binding transcriptional LysR family regulator
MDRFEGMSIVLAVAEAGGLTAAARRQKMPLATVSRKVSELEAHLRTKLFNRTTRAFIPTDAGLSYIAAAKRILADVSEAERAVSGEYTTPRGELTVSTLVALGRLCLQPILSDFLKKFPEVDVHLWRFKRDRTDYVVPVRSRLVASSLESACDAVRAGLGITEAFSYLLADSLNSRQLIPLLQDFQPPPQPVNFVYSPNRFMPAKLRAFLDFAVPRLRERLAVPKGVAPRNSAINRTSRG